MNDKINVVEIIKEIEEKANQKRKLADLKMLEQIDLKKLKGVENSTLKVSDSPDYLISRKLGLRKISKKGLYSKGINYLLRKFYFAMRYLLDSLIVSQENFNLRVNKFISENEKKDLDFDYAQFENIHRGSRDLIKTKFLKYISFFEGGNNVLDLACGRGEFLELLSENGIKGVGVDINSDFVRGLKNRGLEVFELDAFEFLKNRLNTKERLFDGVFSSQFAEHLDSESLISLIKLVYENLSQDSFFVMETINPKSLSVFSNSYYKDPTHKRLIHPELLKFIFESVGFKEVSFIFSSEFKVEEKLSEVAELGKNDIIYNENIRKLNELLFAPQDYAVVGKK